MNEITTIIFDRAETIDLGIKELGERLAKDNELGVVSALYDESIWPFFKHRKGTESCITEDDYLLGLIKRYPSLGDLDTLKKMIRDGFTEVPGTVDVIKNLKRQGYKLGLLSVHSEEWVDFIESVKPIHQYFDVVHYSYMNGLCKPEPEAYTAVLNDLGVNPSEAVMIDDSPRNIEGASKAGMRFGIVFENARQMENQLLQILDSYEPVLS